MPVKIEDIAKDALPMINDLIQVVTKKYKKNAEIEIKEFLEENKSNIEKWTKLLAEGELSQREYEYLIFGLKDIAELKLLKHAGLAQQKIAEVALDALKIVAKVGITLALA